MSNISAIKQTQNLQLQQSDAVALFLETQDSFEQIGSVVEVLPEYFKNLVNHTLYNEDVVTDSFSDMLGLALSIQADVLGQFISDYDISEISYDFQKPDDTPHYQWENFEGAIDFLKMPSSATASIAAAQQRFCDNGFNFQQNNFVSIIPSTPADKLKEWLSGLVATTPQQEAELALNNLIHPKPFAHLNM